MMASISSLGSGAAEFFWLWAGQALVGGTALAVVTWLVIRVFGRRMRAAAAAVLWTVVLIKFLVPTGPAFPVSFANLAQATSRLAPTAWAGVLRQGDVSVDSAGEQLLATAAIEREFTPRGRPGTGKRSASSSAVRYALLGAYLFGAGWVAIRRALRFQRLTARCRALLGVDDRVARIVRRTCASAKLTRVPDVRVSDDYPTPFVLGVRRPVLVLPCRSLADAAELEAVVLHEVAHLRRGDLFVRALEWSVGTVFFFWPVVAWVNRRLDLERETACDEWALSHGRFSAGQYARCLLRFASPDRAIEGVRVATAMAAGPRHVERRIDMVLKSQTDRHVRPKLTLPALLMLAAWTALSLSGAVAGEGDGDADHARQRRMELKKRHHEELMIAKSTAFAEEHPAADVDGDGMANKAERRAYLVALALLDAEAVLAEFPNVDDDGDGVLSVMEAASNMFVVEGVDIQKVELEHRRVARRARGGDVIAAQPVPGRTPAEWLLSDIPAEPTHDQVAAAFNTIEREHEARYLERHPEADADGDGRLTGEEIKVFEEAKMAEHSARLLEEHPEADLDGDGVISKDEMKKLHQTLRILEHHPDADVDGDGVISESERATLLRRTELKAAQDLLGRHPEADADGDGELSTEELRRFKERQHHHTPHHDR